VAACKCHKDSNTINMSKENETIGTKSHAPLSGVRESAVKWFNDKWLEDQFYLTIKHNDIIEGDNTRHPSTLTGREIEAIYKTEHSL